ncbi:MAG: hypothetical protein KDD84_00305 [Caldilineaceae bacterium]|nr:hypothetical protein [Caldilineaceae bacterium]
MSLTPPDDPNMADALVQSATNALRSADQSNPSVADRQVRQPDTWLLRCALMALAEHGSADATLAVVELIRDREPLAAYKILPVLARRAEDDVEIAYFVANRLQALRFLLRRPSDVDRNTWGDQLLNMACAAARLDDDTLAFSCLERLDQAPDIWITLFSQQDRRELLAETVALLGLHPLTNYLIRNAIRHHGDAGAHFLQQVAVNAAAWIAKGRRVARTRRLLQRCVDTVQIATLLTLLSRRYAGAVLALGGDVRAILEQINTIANIQDARRESGVAYRESEHKVLRQVRRPRADIDVDFQFYTLKEAVDHLDLANLHTADRTALAERLSHLGAASDGWTAASAAGTLIRLGELDHAVAVVDRIDPRDPTRSEAYNVLVAGLLDAGQNDEARVQAQKAVRWAQSLPEIHPERMVIWGIAEAYLKHDQAQAALGVLAQRRAPNLTTRLRRLFRGGEVTEDQLREDALRMYAALLNRQGGRDQATPILATIRRQAPQALDGKALAIFYTDHVLAPLLETGSHDLAWSFLHDVRSVLGRILSREQPVRVEAVARLLVEALDTIDAVTNDAVSSKAMDAAHNAARSLLRHLWEGSAQQGIWPTVYSIGGSLPLLIRLVGSSAVVEIAQLANAEGHSWRRRPISELVEENDVEEPERVNAA